MVVKTRVTSPKAKDAQKNTSSSSSSIPIDCPVCDQAGEYLQDSTWTTRSP